MPRKEMKWNHHNTSSITLNSERKSKKEQVGLIGNNYQDGKFNMTVLIIALIINGLKTQLEGRDCQSGFKK